MATYIGQLLQRDNFLVCISGFELLLDFLNHIVDILILIFLMSSDAFHKTFQVTLYQR